MKKYQYTWLKLTMRKHMIQSNIKALRQHDFEEKYINTWKKPTKEEQQTSEWEC
jgi:hypothetical protein